MQERVCGALGDVVADIVVLGRAERRERLKRVK
jgi:hypothetical protein